MFLCPSLCDVHMQQEDAYPMLLIELGQDRGQEQEINSLQELRFTSNPIVFFTGEKASRSNFVSYNINIHIEVQTYGN